MPGYQIDGSQEEVIPMARNVSRESLRLRAMDVVVCRALNRPDTPTMQAYGDPCFHFTNGVKLDDELEAAKYMAEVATGHGVWPHGIAVEPWMDGWYVTSHLQKVANLEVQVEGWYVVWSFNGRFDGLYGETLVLLFKRLFERMMESDPIMVNECGALMTAIRLHTAQA